jgi:hypothetical protein
MFPYSEDKETVLVADLAAILKHNDDNEDVSTDYNG